VSVDADYSRVQDTAKKTYKDLDRCARTGHGHMYVARGGDTVFCARVN
jgi:hypothetical protein